MDNGVATVALAVLAGVSLLWTLGLLLAFMELRQLSQRIQEALRTLELELLPLARETREALRRLNQVSLGVEASNAKLQDALEAFQRAGQNVQMTTEALRAVFGSRLIPMAGVLAGVRAGVRLLWKTVRERRKAS
jgi:uncharacterized protein YoxC